MLMANTYLWFPAGFLVIFVVIYLLCRCHSSSYCCFCELIRLAFKQSLVRKSWMYVSGHIRSSSVWTTKMSWLMEALLEGLHGTVRFLSRDAPGHCKCSSQTVHTYPNLSGFRMQKGVMLRMWGGCNFQPVHMCTSDWLSWWASLRRGKTKTCKALAQSLGNIVSQYLQRHLIWPDRIVQKHNHY